MIKAGKTTGFNIWSNYAYYLYSYYLFPCRRTAAVAGDIQKNQQKNRSCRRCSSLALAGALLLLAVLPGNSFYGKVITHAENTHGRKLIALTFDDGPYPPYTQKLLKLLAAKNVHATFFMVGENAAKHPETVKLVQAQGP